ncbi:hypothetical protein [Mycobacterium sp.]|uniref:hypothetical protein n=1 Tax=Mycobacterium sp. TaxID=1785 RepID=UPI003C78BF68
MRNQFTIGELLDSISEEHLGDRQATLNELMRIADAGVELFYTAIAHRDVTLKVLEEARGLWGPLADVARLMLTVDKPRKRGDQYGSRVMNHPVAQPVQLSPEILREMADMDLLPHDGDPFWDEMWDEFVAHLGGVPQALKACRKRQLAGQHDLRAYVVAAVRSYRRKAERGGGWLPTAERYSAGRKHPPGGGADED